MVKKNRLLQVATIMLPLVLFSLFSFGQSVTVRGTVTDNTGATIVGANVVNQGTNTGAITDVNGKYQIQVDAKSILTFSFIGYESQSVVVGNKKEINVKLLMSDLQVDEIVVVGYGTQRKEAVTGSVATIKGETLRDVPAANISQALQGRIAGVDLQQTSSKPGAAMQIRVRGVRSLNASNDPLIVLNGIPFAGSISDINPSDIQSVDILKDASATAIYGSRGANGVIMISTYGGKKGQAAQVTYNGYQGVNTIFAKYPMMEGPEFVALRKTAGLYPTNGADEADDVNTDWQDLFYRTGTITNHNIAVSGGTEKGNYNFGAGYYKEQAIMPGQDYTRFSFRGTLDQEIGELFRFGFTSNNNYSVNNGGNLSLYNVLSMSPIVNPYNADGTWKRTVKMPLDEQWTQTRDIVDHLGDSWIDQTRGFGSYNSMYGELKIPGVEGLKLKSSMSGNLRMSAGGNYTGMGLFSSTASTVSTASISNSLTTNWTIENLLTYDHTFADKHAFNVVGMYSAEQTKYNRSSMAAKDIPADAFQFYNIGRANGIQTIDPNGQDYQLSGLMSYMGRVMYAYDSRYMLSATLRSDASSRLAEGHKWHNYSAVSAGWNIHKESFMKDLSIINLMKLRVGYGETSNQSIDPYATLGLLTTRPYNFGTTYATGLYVSKLPNPDLGWEYSKTWNFAMDFSLLKSRLSGTVEYYITKTENVLLDVSLPATSGVSSVTANIGSTQNKGLELSLNGVILDNPNGWSWEVGVNLYANRNKLTALASGAQDDKNNWWFVGHPINVVYDYKKIGLWQEGDANMNLYETATDAKPGMIKVEYTGTFNADGTPTRKIGDDDRQVLDLESDFQGGFNSRLAYKRFDLTVVGVYQSGGTLISTLYGSSGYLNLMTGRRGNVQVDYWTPENTDAKYPKPGGIMSGDAPKYASTLAYFDGSYLKIRSLTLGYNFNEKLLKNAGIGKLRLYGTVQNPFVLFSPYYNETGMDPETNSYGNENAAVSYSYNLRRLLTIGTNTPSTRRFMVGIDLTF